jgi:hypothetical protein
LKDIKLQSLITLLESYRKKVFRYGVFLYIVPFLFFTIELGILNKISVAYFEVTKTEFLRLFLPIIYIVVATMFALQNIKALKIAYQISELAKISDEDPWLEKLRASFLTSYLMNQFSKSWFQGVVFYLPLFIFIIGIPLGFMIYGIYDIYSIMVEKSNAMSTICIIAVIWAFVGCMFTWFRNIKLDIQGEPIEK